MFIYPAQCKASACILEMLVRNVRGTLAAAARQFSAAAVTEKGIVSGGEGKKSGGGGDTLGRRLFSLVYGKRSAVITIRKWKEEGHTVRKYELNRIVRELRKLKRYKHALEVRIRLIAFALFFNF